MQHVVHIESAQQNETHHKSQTSDSGAPKHASHVHTRTSVAAVLSFMLHSLTALNFVMMSSRTLALPDISLLSPDRSTINGSASQLCSASLCI